MKLYFDRLWFLGRLAGYMPAQIYWLATLYLVLVLLDIVGLSLLSVWFSQGDEISQIEIHHFVLSDVDDRTLLLILLAVFFAKFISALFVSWVLSRRTLKFLSRLRSQVFQRYLNLNNNSSGNLKDKLQIILDFTNICGSRIPEMLIKFLGEGLILFGVVGFLLYRYGWAFVLIIMLCACFLILIAGLLMSRQGARLGVLITQKQNDIIGISAEVLPKLDEVSINGYGPWISKKFDNASMEHAGHLAHERYVSSIPKYFFELLVLMSLIAVIFWKSLISGQQVEAAIVELVILAVAGLKTLPFINQMVTTIYLYKASGPAVHGLGSLFSSDQTETDLNTPSDVRTSNNLRSLIINDAILRLSDGRQLQVPSLEFEAGDVVAVSGPSGVGKSSFFKLLLGLNSEPSPASWIGRDGQLRSIRGVSSYLSQGGLIFNQSLKDNVAVASDGKIDEDRYLRACTDACLTEEFIRQWTNEPLGDDGARVSGGERQRVLIARLFYENKPLWFLDEATSALDAANEQKVFDKIIKQGDKVVLVISHSAYQSNRYSRHLSIRRSQVVED